MNKEVYTTVSVTVCDTDPECCSNQCPFMRGQYCALTGGLLKFKGSTGYLTRTDKCLEGEKDAEKRSGGNFVYRSGGE